MEKTLVAVNQMLKLGIITDYAIGGGMAAMFYACKFSALEGPL